jgi:4-diphosphocytidyl-2-C-methyl-D-erythritol kinase
MEVVRGARIRLFKRIPSQAGLGGGSSDAVAAIFAARCAWNLTVSNEELMKIAAEIGSDCPIFFHRNASFSWGRGEKSRQIENIPKLYFVVLKPKEGLSTANVYDKCMSCHEGQFRQAEELLEAFKSGDIARIGRCFFNRLEAPARLIWHRFDEIYRKLEKLDCLAVRMSGSGTAFYGLCRNARHARFAAAQLRQQTNQNELVFNVEN